MEVKYTACFIIISYVSGDVISTISTKDVRTGVLLKPEKFINGVIDIVQSHKNKPNQQNSQQYPNYQQYPQQWNSQNNYQNANFQNGFNSQSQYQGQFNAQNQYNYQNGYNQQSFPQNGNYQGFSAPNQGFGTQGQTQQYQVVYQNIPNQMNQAGNQYQGQSGSGTNGQFFGTTQSVNQQQGTGGQYQSSSGQYQGSGHYQGSSGNYHGSSGQYQGTTGQNQGSTTDGSGQINGQGFLVSSGQSGQGPTCVCQAWTKPEVLSDAPVPDKVEKATDIMPQTRIF